MGDGLLVYLLVSAGVILLSYVAMRYLATWQAGRLQGRRMRILEVLPVGRDRQLLLVAIGNEVLLIGTSPTGTQLVHQVDDPETVTALLAGGEPSERPAGAAQSGLMTGVAAAQAGPAINTGIAQPGPAAYGSVEGSSPAVSVGAWLQQVPGSGLFQRTLARFLTGGAAPDGNGLPGTGADPGAAGAAAGTQGPATPAPEVEDAEARIRASLMRMRNALRREDGGDDGA